MATPSIKHPAMESFINRTTGSNRQRDITNNICVLAPFGCGGPATTFKDALSAKEYTISGLCQKCQDEIFNQQF